MTKLSFLKLKIQPLIRIGGTVKSIDVTFFETGRKKRSVGNAEADIDVVIETENNSTDLNLVTSSVNENIQNGASDVIEPGHVVQGELFIIINYMISIMKLSPDFVFLI